MNCWKIKKLQAQNFRNLDKSVFEFVPGINCVFGQNGNGKGVFQAKDTFKPFPQSFINMLTDEKGAPLDQAQAAKYQNPGYN